MCRAMACSGPSGSETLQLCLGSHSLMPWKFWSTLLCVQLLLMVDSTQAVRMLQQKASQQRRLQAFSDESNNPRHAPAVKSFLVSDGSWVDCIPIEGQIAAHHPALKDHIIKMTPSSACRSKLHPQLFAREHGGCPEGSIPVLRTDPFHGLQKKGSPVSTLADTSATGNETHEYAVKGLPELSQPSYSGTHTILSVNSPELGDSTTDFSLSQLWIAEGKTTDNTLSTIEVGWQKFPTFHQNLNDGDPNAPHLFIFWTNDNYLKSSDRSGSCYNILNCAGFVQTNPNWVIGGAMPSYTTLAENAPTESEVEIEVLYDPGAQVWQLSLNKDVVGYWPSSIFNGRLQGTATSVQWGGEVMFYKYTTTTTHSKTTMGSGAFPSAGYPVAAYHKDITYADATGTFTSPVLSELITIAPKPQCYDIAISQDTNTGSIYFYYGGPGGNNPACA